MASIKAAIPAVKRDLSRLIDEATVEQACREAGHGHNACRLTPTLTVRLLMTQLLAGVALAGLRRVARVTVSAAAICKARMRLPRAVWLRLVELTGDGDGDAAAAPDSSSSSWRGLRVLLADGMSFLAADTPELAARYGKAKNGRGVSEGYPVPKLLALVDFATGLIRKVVALPAARQERACLARLIKLLSAGDLLLGDRGLVSFAHLAAALAAGAHACLRLPAWAVCGQKHRGTRRRVKRLGAGDYLVSWSRPRRGPHSWLSRRSWSKLPEALQLRQVRWALPARRGFRRRYAWAVTTLLDPVAYPAAEVAELYAKRWHIEVCFRDLKATLGMGDGPLSARTSEGLRKEVLAFVLLYNLVRRVMAEAAAARGVEPARVSFADAAAWLLWAEPGEGIPADLALNPARPWRASQPRRLKRGRKRYPQLKGPRPRTSRPDGRRRKS